MLPPAPLPMRADSRNDYDVWMFRTLLALLLLAGCATPPQSTTPPITSRDQQFGIRNQGYSLLHSLLADEQNVSKLLLIKNENPDLGALIKDISRVSKEAAAQIEKFSKNDPHLHLDMPGLPLVEQQTRDSIGKTKAKELVTKAGQKFEVRIILSQAEALTYGAHLALVTAAHDSDPTRQQFLRKTSEELHALHQRIINLIHARWDSPAK